MATLGLLLPAVWFAAVFLIARPLANGPVADSWLYVRAIRRWEAGVLALPGFTAAIPAAQILYGAIWSRLFGLNFVSLDWSVAVLGIAGAMLFYRLARRCHGTPQAAALATMLLAVNPCYLFLSFSFMTDVPFLVLLIGAYAMYAGAREGRGTARLWICAALLLIAFMVRPFALAADAGCGAAIVLWRRPGQRPGAVMVRLLPFFTAACASVLIWLWFKSVMPVPWMLNLRAGRLGYLYLVSARVYFTDAILAPMLYMGLILSPLALPHLISPRWRLGLGIAAGLALVTFPFLLTDPGAGSIPELSCCGAWNNVLVLRGPLRFLWTNFPLQVVALAVSILGASGLVLAAIEIKSPAETVAAVMFSTAIYWAGMVPLWLFNDRYYLVMIPAGCLLLALAPTPRSLTSRGMALAMIAVLGWFAAAGVYDQQRGLDAVIAARDALLAQGIPRQSIDAGYPLNGYDLYRDPSLGSQETEVLEAGIPMVTTWQHKPYTIAAATMADTAVIGRFHWPGIFGFGRRTLYVLKAAQPAGAMEASDGAGVKARLPRDTDLNGQTGLLLAAARLAAMALVMLAPMAAAGPWMLHLRKNRETARRMRG